MTDTVSIDAHKTEAKKHLKRLREGTELYDARLERLHSEVSKGGFTFKDIGTNEEELERLRVKSHKILAHKYLGWIRNRNELYHETYDRYFERLHSEVSKGGFTLEDIGTSKEELEKLRIRNCKYAAQTHLGFLRKGMYNYDAHLKSFRSEVSRGGFTLESIGTSEEELVSFQQVTQ